MRYLYKCDSCDHENYIEHKMTETPSVDCECCGSEMRRKIEPTRVMYRGDWETRDTMGTHD